MVDLYAGAGDELPAFLQQMILPSGDAENLSSKTVKFSLRRVVRSAAGETRVIVVDKADATVTDAVNGWASYGLTSGQAALLTEGRYELRWHVYSGTQQMSFPNDRWLPLNVT